MRIRPFLLSSVVFGSLVAMSSASWSQSSPKMVYKPQGEWAVTRMASKGPGKDPYCTMARRFGDNVILTFARNAKDETSLAIDFQPKTLAKGQNYYVALDAGSNEKRAFDVMPVSDKAMVIRLGQDQKFHDALNTSGVLNVDVAGLELEFDVPDMSKGHENLGSCVAGLVEPAAGKVAETIARKPVASEPMPMPEEVIAEATVEPPAEPLAKIAEAPIARRATDDILAAPSKPSRANVISAPPVQMAQVNNEEAEGLREENLRLKNALERERRAYEDRAMREGPGSSQVSEAMEKMRILEAENSQLKSRLVGANQDGPMMPVVSEPDPKWLEEIATLRRENEGLKADMSKKLADVPGDAKLAAEITQLRAQNDSLQSELALQKGGNSDADPKAVSEMSILRNENARLKMTIQAQQDGVALPDPKVNAELTELRSENERLKTDIEAQKLSSADVDPKIAQEIVALRAENESLKAGKKDGGMGFDSKLALEVAKLRDQNMKLQAEIDTQKSVANPDLKMNDEMAALRKENEGLKAEVAANKTTKPGADPQQANEIAMLRDENQSLRNAMASQKASNALTPDPMSADEVAMLREENEGLRSEIAMQKSAMSDLQSKKGTNAAGGKDPVDANAMARMQSRIQDLTTQNTKLQSDLVAAQIGTSSSEEGGVTVSQLRTLEQQLKSVEAERNNLRTQMDKMANGQEDGLLKAAGSDWNLEQSTRRFNEAEREVRRLGAQLEQARSQCTAEKKEIEYMLFDPAIADKEQISKLMSLEEEVKRKDAEVSNLKAQLGGMSTPAMNSEAVRKSIASDNVRPQVRAAAPMQVSSIEPAAGTPRAPVNSPMSGSAMMPFAADEVQSEPIAAPVSPPAAAPVPAPMPVAAVPAPAVMSSGTKLVTADALSNQLRQSGLALSGNVKKIDNVSSPSFVAYSWQASGLYGTAEQKPMSSPEQFQTMVNQYLDKTKSRCQGDFAASPVPTMNVPGTSVASYEVACVGAEGAGATAALAFYGKDGLFTTVAHESNIDTMETAMDARDRVIAGLGKATN